MLLQFDLRLIHIDKLQGLMLIEDLLEAKMEYDIGKGRYIPILDILMNFIDLHMKSGVKIEYNLWSSIKK